MQPSGIITITTDFGHRGPFTGIMKGVILGRFPAAKIIDLIHDISAQSAGEAGFWVSRSYGWFPAGTVHVAVVDPGVGTDRGILLVEHDGHWFLAPDNGLLAELIAAGGNAASVFRLDLQALSRLHIEAQSMTFHGRDVFAPVAAELAAGHTTAVAIGRPATQWVPADLPAPQSAGNGATGVIVTVDTFGNLISNLDQELVRKLVRPVVRIADRDVPLRGTYGEAQPGELLALINAFGVLEIAVARGSAAESLGLGRGTAVIVTAAAGG